MLKEACAMRHFALHHQRAGAQFRAQDAKEMLFFRHLRLHQS
jgi:hypothetical protein